MDLYPQQKLLLVPVSLTAPPLSSLPPTYRLQRKYEEHSYLWKTDLEGHFKDFCDDAVILTPLGQKILDLTKFDQVGSYVHTDRYVDR